MKSRWRVMLVAIVILSALTASAQWRSLGPWSLSSHAPSVIELVTPGARMRITALSPSVVRIQYLPSGVPPAEQFATVADPGFMAPNLPIKERPETLELSTGKFLLSVAKATGAVTFTELDGTPIVADPADHPPAWNGSAFRVWKTMPIDEHYFGLGDKAGPIDHRDRAFTMWDTDAYGWTGGTDPLYKSIPFFMALRAGRAYGIFLDNSFRSSFDFGKQDRRFYSFGADGGQLDYYFFYGPDPKEVLEEYTALTGRTPLPPRWALGYQQSRYSYFPESRVYEIAHEFRSRKIPCDAIYLDIDYEDGHRSFTVDRTRFPHFGQMIRDLGGQGFKVVTIVDPHLKQEAGYKPYDEGHARGYFVRNPDGSDYAGKVWPGESVFPDFTRAEVRQWWGTLYTDLVHMGVAGIWNDMNEPAVFRYPQKTMPLDSVHSIEGRKTDHREAHNLYGMQNSRATYDGLLQLRSNERPFVLTRAGFAGGQRYAATWTGDNQSTWEHYTLTLPTLLSMGASGWPFVGNDVGGFDGSPTPDLLTRWFEIGAFEPMFRDHTSTGTRDQEPWVHGPEQEAIRRRYIELRYRLMPYLYTSMEETSRTGLPLMRAMFLQYPSDPDLATNDREFLFGSDLLVAPKPDERLDPYEVRLPQGQWYDFWRGTETDGASSIKVDPPLDMLPIYVRAGAILPMEQVTQNTAEQAPGPLQLRVYPGPDCHGSMYWDDGSTFNYRQGDFARTDFTCTQGQDSLVIGISARAGSYVPHWNSLAITVYGANAAPASILAGTQKLTSTFDAAAHSFTFEMPWTGAAQRLELKY